MGVPALKRYADDVNNLNLPDRSTVQDTYEQAIDDLKAAARLMEMEKFKTRRSCHDSKEAGMGHVVSYLFIEEEELMKHLNSENAQLAIDYATKVIESTTDEGGSEELLSENFMRV
ncbi:RagB/SusD family nutrient uptake outer membrane protein [Bacteroides fragilis]|nr:RagB/SusD family nutrient uptake outer membrane protein [Bacteroides fragilis]